VGKKRDIERLERQLSAANENINALEPALRDAEKERDNLRRQLSRIREACEELQHAIYPNTFRPNIAPSTPGVLPSLPGMSSITWNT
jgi:predicted  nucleic acid-binding Zn-ribbon protein